MKMVMEFVTKRRIDNHESIELSKTTREQPIKKGTQPGAFFISRTDNGHFALKYP
jgi:hypothetical protein